MSMGINEIFGRGIGFESSGLVGASRAIASHLHILLESFTKARKPSILKV